MSFSELVKYIDAFCQKYKFEPSVRADLVDLVQKAIEHGEAKEQNKIAGIAVKALKAFMGGGKG
jgi:sulfur relay (sulfurtransferase) DsrC/TusE family protein